MGDRRRVAAGTQPPVTSAAATAVAGTIEPQTERVEKERASEHAVGARVDDDWLDRLDLPPD